MRFFNLKILVSTTGELFQLTKGNFQHSVNIANMFFIRSFRKLPVFGVFLNNVQYYFWYKYMEVQIHIYL